MTLTSINYGHVYVLELTSFMESNFSRKYLPILKGYPVKYIHAPWNAPENIQRAAKCIIGRDYPKPIVNHAEISCANLEKMQEVYRSLLLCKVNSGKVDNRNLNSPNLP